MAHFVLDSYAMLAYFRNEDGREKIEQLLNDAVADKHELYMSCLNAGEVYYMAYRKDGADKAALVWKALQQFPLHITEVDMAFTHKAANLKARYKLSYADAFAAALTISKKAVLITGDNEFEALSKEANFKVKYL
ncbi:MAG: type II toxin-antitoxin system VapC family toxin [Sphingobacteriales bacterium]|nr:type II toxin-antitoxin system VapC family toxin [Sphingobacteriales bacterium]